MLNVLVFPGLSECIQNLEKHFSFFLSDKYYYKRINSYVQTCWQFNIIPHVCTGSEGQNMIFKGMLGSES